MTRFNEYVKVAEAEQIVGVAEGIVCMLAEIRRIPMACNPVSGSFVPKRCDLIRALKHVAKPVKVK